MKIRTFIACVCLFAFCNAAPEASAQGKIWFGNDSLHLVYFNSDPNWLLPADMGTAGQVIPAGGVTHSGITLTAELWGGTSSSSLVKLTSTTFGSSPGLLNGVNVVTPFALGTTAFFQVLVYDVTASSFYEAAAFARYYGESPIFSAVTGANVTYNRITDLDAPAYSTWAPGSWNPNSLDWGVGARGAISIQATIPEPGSSGLLCLGAAGLMLMRRCGRPAKSAIRAR